MSSDVLEIDFTSNTPHKTAAPNTNTNMNTSKTPISIITISSSFLYESLNLLTKTPTPVSAKMKKKKRKADSVPLEMRETREKIDKKSIQKTREEIRNLCIKTRDIAENTYKLTNENAVASQLNEMMNKFNQTINPIFTKIEMVKPDVVTNLEKKIDNIIKILTNSVNFSNQYA